MEVIIIQRHRGKQRMEQARGHKVGVIPTKRQRHHSYDESVDEPAQLIESEAVDVEAEIPLERNQSVETSNREDDVPPE
jgi:hypothetical protein